MKTDKITLEDGRLAERKTYSDADGNEVVDIFVEPKREKNLEKRIINKKKEILAEQVIQTIRDGEVVEEEVFSKEPEVKLEKRRHIQRVNNGDEGEYVTKKQLVEGITESMRAIVEPLNARMAKFEEPPVFQSQNCCNPVSAQSVVEQRVMAKEGTNYALWGTIFLLETAAIIALWLGWIPV